MGSLRDEAFEKLDYLSQITEIIVSTHDELLCSIPEQTELSFKDVLASKTTFWTANPGFRITLPALLRAKYDMSWSIARDLEDCFKFEVAPDTTIDFKNKVIYGAIRLVKVRTRF